ncbi:hypothetical protein L195_g038207, partial [Trifolium pratense]
MFDLQNVVVGVHNPGDDNLVNPVDGVLNSAQDVHDAVEGVVNGQIIPGDAVI